MAAVIRRKFHQAAATGSPFRGNPSFLNMPEKFSAPIPVRPAISLEIQDSDLAHRGR
jgi:hypothetical protein